MIATIRQRPIGANPIYWASFRDTFPQDWVVKVVGQMSTTIKGKLPSVIFDKPTEHSKPYLLMDGLRGGTHLFTEDINLPSVTETDIIMIADGSKSGYSLRGFSGVLGSTLLMFHAHNEVNPSYLFHLLSSLFPFLNSTTTGTAVPHLDQDLLLKLPLRIPDKPEEQEAIARILDAVDTAIGWTREVVKRAQDLDHSLLHDLLENGLAGKLRNGKKQSSQWAIRRVDEVAAVGSGVTLGKDVSGFESIDLPYLRVANVQDGHLDLSVIKMVQVRVDEVENYRLESGDVLMTEGGDIDKLGRGTIWEGQITPCLHQNHIFRVRAKRELLDPYYFAFVVESDIAKRYFFRVAKRTTNLASINKTQLRAFRFPVPPLEEQEQLADIIKAAKATTKGLVEKGNALQNLKRALTHDLLTGKVRVNHAIDKIIASEAS